MKQNDQGVGSFLAITGNPLPHDDRMGRFWYKQLITAQFVQFLQIVHVALGTELIKQVAQSDASPASRNTE